MSVHQSVSLNYRKNSQINFPELAISNFKNQNLKDRINNFISKNDIFFYKFKVFSAAYAFLKKLRVFLRTFMLC